ncbi:MAG: glycosyltransferase family 2 protein, partial [Gemmatimonadota bacterium]
MIYIGIPVHNERHTIGPLLWRVRELLYGGRREFHVLVCDDASDDGTDERLAPYPRVLPLTVLTNETRRGYGASVERIVRAAARRSGYPKRDALVMLQADFTDPPEAIPEMVKRFEGGADLVTVEPVEGEARGRRWARAGARWLARGVPVPPEAGDPYGSLRLYRLFVLSRALQDLNAEGRPLMSHDGWAANAELLLRAWPNVRRVELIESPSDYGRRYRDSRFRPLNEVRELVRAARDPAVR